MRKILVVLLLVPVAAWGADQFADLAKYYPMKTGSVWSYAIKGDTPDEVITATDCNETDGCLFEHLIMNGIKMHDAYKYIGNTVSRTYTSDFFTGEMERLTPAEVKLKSPLKAGISWKNVEGINSEKFKVVKIIPSMKVIAGEFKDVLVIESMKYEGKNDTIGQLTYYAPDVGMIKTEGSYKLKGKRSKMSRTRELIEYRP